MHTHSLWRIKIIFYSAKRYQNLFEDNSVRVCLIANQNTVKLKMPKEIEHIDCVWRVAWDISGFSLTLSFMTLFFLNGIAFYSDWKKVFSCIECYLFSYWAFFPALYISLLLILTSELAALLNALTSKRKSNSTNYLCNGDEMGD